MVYIFGFVGFVMGFGVGLGMINVALRYKSKEEIRSDPSLKWKYGPWAWVFGGLGSWLGVWIYNHYFL